MNKKDKLRIYLIPIMLTLSSAIMAMAWLGHLKYKEDLSFLMALFFFGGEMIRGFSQALIIGVLVGTYSSIYVVANMLLSLSITQDDLAIPEPEGLEFDDMP